MFVIGLMKPMEPYKGPLDTGFHFSYMYLMWQDPGDYKIELNYS